MSSFPIAIAKAIQLYHSFFCRACNYIIICLRSLSLSYERDGHKIIKVSPLIFIFSALLKITKVIFYSHPDEKDCGGGAMEKELARAGGGGVSY